MHRFLNEQGSVLFIQRPREVQDFLARQPRVLPTVLPRRRPSALAIVAKLLLVAVAMVGVAGLLLVAFFLFGEERPDRVRPELTPAQRAKAFHIPHS